MAVGSSGNGTTPGQSGNASAAVTLAGSLQFGGMADISEFPTSENKIDLAAIGDLYHHGIVG